MNPKDNPFYTTGFAEGYNAGLRAAASLVVEPNHDDPPGQGLWFEIDEYDGRAALLDFRDAILRLAEDTGPKNCGFIEKADV